MPTLQDALTISIESIEIINRFLNSTDNPLTSQLFKIVDKYGGPQEINRKAAEAGKLENLLEQLKATQSPYLADLEWLMEQREQKRFVSRDEYLHRVLGANVGTVTINQQNAVTLEISALQYFPWIITQARQAIDKRELMPGRFIRVRNMQEQAQDNGDILATAAAMQIIGASYVETLDTRGTDGANVHLGGPETITGYFGGVGQPNDYPLKWVDEFLYHYTTYGIRQVLNVNPGTVLVGYFLHKLGIDNEFKISVFMGNDNPFAILWTLMTARMFARTDNSTSLVGFNLSNSVDNNTIRKASRIRSALGLEAAVRFEHHITETYKSIVRQPYNRRVELVEVAQEVPNIAAKHEGGEPEIEAGLAHPSDILDYFMTKDDILKADLMPALEQNYLEKHSSVNLTADALTQAGIGIVVARNLHF